MKRIAEDIVIISATALMVIVIETQYVNALWWLMNRGTYLYTALTCMALAVIGVSNVTTDHPNRKKVSIAKIFISIVAFVVVYAALVASGVVWDCIHGGHNVATAFFQRIWFER